MTGNNLVFGCKKAFSVPEVHVEDIFSSSSFSNHKHHDKLSKPKTQLPSFMQDPQYRHGVSTSKIDGDAKQLIYAANANCDKDKENKSSEPGQQKMRQYEWPPNVNPNTTTFGVMNDLANRSGSDGVSSALCREDAGSPVDDTRAQSHDPEKIFGVSTSMSNSSTADCLVIEDNHGEDDDLGKSLTPGYRNVSTERAFGCPSMRNDIPKYEKASVADSNNYGDSVTAGYLLRPSIYSQMGVDEDEPRKTRSKAYLKRLFHNCGLIEDDDNFESVLNRVSDSQGLASINSIKAVLCSERK